MESQEFEKILQLALFTIDDEAETKSKVDIQLRVDQVTKVFKRLQDARVQAVEKFLEDEKTLNNVKAWSNQATERMRRVTEYRQQIEVKLESVINEERETAERRQIDIQIEAQRKINAERLEVLEREQQLKEQLTRRTNDGNDGETRALAKPQAVKLQRYTVTPFEGDYKDWLCFWNQFSAEVDGSSMAEISKFNYLLELVKGKPKEDILGLPHSTEGYAEAKKDLWTPTENQGAKSSYQRLGAAKRYTSTISTQRIARVQVSEHDG